MKKKVISTVLVVIMLVALFSGCATKTTTPTEPVKKDVTLNLVLSKAEHTDDIVNYLPAFEEKTGIKVNTEIIVESSYNQKMMLGLSAAKTQYDVVMASPAMFGQLLESEWVQPIEKYLSDSSITSESWRNGISDSMLELVVNHGKRYAVPYQMGASILFYNKAMLKEAGLDPSNPPSTLGDIMEAAKKINNPSANKYGITFRANREQNINTFLWAMLWMAQDGTWENDDGTLNYDALDGEAAVNATQFFADFHKYAPKGISGYGFEEAMLAFQQGLAAMWIDTSILGGNVLDPEKSSVADDVGFVAFTEGHAIGSPWVMLMSSKTEYPEEAWQLMQYLTDYDIQMAQVKSGLQTGPVRSDVLLDPEIGNYLNAELAAAINDALARDPVTNYFPPISQMTEIRGVIAIAISDVAEGKMTAEDAMAAVQTDVHAILKRDGVIE